MDLLDLLWNANQERQLADVRGRLDQLRQEHDLGRGDLRTVTDLAAENLELKLRLGLRGRLLISRGVFPAQEYAALTAGGGPRSRGAGGGPPTPAWEGGNRQ